MQIAQRSVDGWPFIEWTENVPTGKSVYQDWMSFSLKASILTGIGVFALATYFGASAGGAALFAFIIFGIVLGGASNSYKSPLEGMPLPGGGRVPVTPGPTDAQRRREAIQRATPVMTTCTSSVAVKPGVLAVDRTLLFVSKKHQRGMEPSTIEIPFEAVNEFCLGTKSEWYDPISMRGVSQAYQDADTLVIVAPTTGYGVIPVAESGDDKASIADLHGRLVKTFIVDRRDLWKKFDDGKGR